MSSKKIKLQLAQLAANEIHYFLIYQIILLPFIGWNEENVSVQFFFLFMVEWFFLLFLLFLDSGKSYQSRICLRSQDQVIKCSVLEYFIGE